MSDFKLIDQYWKWSDVEKWKLGFERYEKLRKLTHREAADFWLFCRKYEKNFDDEVDKLGGP